MSFLGDALEPRAYQCPNCRKYISSNDPSCKFCAVVISDEMRSAAIDHERAEQKAAALNGHKRTIYLGLAMLAGSLVTIFQPILAVTFSSGGTFSCLTPILFMLGVGAIIFGTLGYLRERRN